MAEKTTKGRPKGLTDAQLKRMDAKYGDQVRELLAAGATRDSIAKTVRGASPHFIWAVALTEGFVKTKTARGAKLLASWTKRFASINAPEATEQVA